MFLPQLLIPVLAILSATAASPYAKPFDRIYDGVPNSSTGLNILKGIRFRRSTNWILRWQLPQLPALNRSSVISAASFSPACQQSPNSVTGKVFKLGHEDCLFLNVYAPSNASSLPDMSPIINTNNNGPTGVAIQYRVRPLPLIQAHPNGVTNVRILDQHSTLQWVQADISLFGGNSSQVVIGVIPAGRGSIVLRNIASGGTLGTSLFVNPISASLSECPPTWAYGNSSQTVFEYLLSQDTETLQQASFLVSSSGAYGSWGFLPVSSTNHLSGNNVEEDIAKALYYYSTFNSTNTGELSEFATSRDVGLMAVNVSQVESGQQQRANKIYAETTFVCPSHWIAEAYNGHGRSGYKYQYSLPNAFHSAGAAAHFGPFTPNQGPGLILAFQKIWGTFIITSKPSVSSGVVNGASSKSTEKSTLENWPPFTLYSPVQANFN
ncbi:alpha/beta-hydrolase [Zopfia rhizophila CBS 207.26]|uniref:Alpha/beta-hydrolase n=1 Tax=Zopfia rhizophila CBS 207.26 TaxID=1314779 RepID=A0A6A6ENT5_9PEZI|nr:alpha/beta-hydrolase [Zopfia rhizophila CBS 207.26]